MSNEVFSYTIDTPYEEELRFNTIVSESEGGREQRYKKWARPRRTFRIRLDARSNTDATDVWDFYKRHSGSFDSFLFPNPSETPVTAETIGSGDGVKSVYYFGNKVGIGTGDLILISGSETMTRSIGGTGDYLSFTAYTTDNPIGQLTTNSVLASGDVLRANYGFRYRVRFKDEGLTRENFATNLYRFGVELIEVI